MISSWNDAGGERALSRTALARQRTRVPDKLTWDLFLGACAHVDVPPASITRFIWRGWVDCGHGRARRHGRAPDRPAVLGAGSRLPDDGRNRLDAVQQGVVPDGDDDALRVPRARQQTGREAHVVRRRAAAAAPEELERREARTRTGGVLFIGTQGQVDARDVRLPTRVCCRRRCTQSATMPPETLPRITTSHEMNWVDAAKGKTEASSPVRRTPPGSPR